MQIKIDSIEDKINKKGTSSRKALYEALQDVAAHFVVEAEGEGLAQASTIMLSAIVKADKGKLRMSDDLGLVAEAIGLAERLAYGRGTSPPVFKKPLT